MEYGRKIDDFVLDPTRVTLYIRTSLDGHTLRRLLMDRYGIQVNKVSLTTILLQFNIGTLRSSVSFLLGCLLELSHELLSSVNASRLPSESILAPPKFTSFAPSYKPYGDLAAGTLRRAYYDAQKTDATEMLSIPKVLEFLNQGKELISAAIIIPVPPGVPALLPGQVITTEIINYLAKIDPNSILSGYPFHKGIKVFKGF